MTRLLVQNKSWKYVLIIVTFVCEHIVLTCCKSLQVPLQSLSSSTISFSFTNFLHYRLQMVTCFVYDGIGDICLCINLIHSAACFALHEGCQILCPDVSNRVERCKTFRETMVVHILQCAHRHLEWNNELLETEMFLLHPYNRSFGFHAPNTNSFNWVLNVLKNATMNTWLAKACFLLAIHSNLKINTIYKYSFNDSMRVRCQHHVH
jgi:hypothetical protein